MMHFSAKIKKAKPNNVVSLSHLNGNYAWQRLACIGSSLNSDAKGVGIFHHSYQGSSGHGDR